MDSGVSWSEWALSPHLSPSGLQWSGWDSSRSAAMGGAALAPPVGEPGPGASASGSPGDPLEPHEDDQRDGADRDAGGQLGGHRAVGDGGGEHADGATGKHGGDEGDHARDRPKPLAAPSPGTPDPRAAPRTGRSSPLGLSEAMSTPLRARRS